MPPYLTRIEGPPPKRNAVRSSRAGGAVTAVLPDGERQFVLRKGMNMRVSGEKQLLLSLL